MEQWKLDSILDRHAKWLCGEGSGKRADLRGADLHRANLREADLREANLHGADLHGADLHGADLHGADLREAKGIVCLPVGDPTFRPVAVDYSDHWMIASGCRWFTVAEARAHWGAANYKRGRLIGDQYLSALHWLEVSSAAIRGEWS